MSRPTFRFAPSPNGRLHLGHAYSALLNERLARENGGRFLLRIEDIDRERSRPEFVAAIRSDLSWLGLSWEEPVRCQSEHLADYEAAAGRLRAEGLLYPCFCSRAEIGRVVEDSAAREGRPVARDPDGAPLYPGTCRGLSEDEIAARIAEGRRPAWRIAMAEVLARIGPEPLRWIRFDPGNVESPEEGTANSLPPYPESLAGNSLSRHPEEPAERASRRAHQDRACFETRPAAAPQHDAGREPYFESDSEVPRDAGPRRTHPRSAACFEPGLQPAPQHEERRVSGSGVFPSRTEDSVLARPDRWGDAVLVRRDTPTSYHLSVVVDDAIQGVTHVVRGRDLEAATDLHRLLQALLGLLSPRYHHHGLILDQEGEKLAKRAGSPSLTDLREAGATPESVRRRLGF